MRRGQTILEYLMIFAVVSAAILGMQVYAKRGIQATMKTAADQMSPVADDADGRAAQALGMQLESQEIDVDPQKPQKRKQIVPGKMWKKGSLFTTNANQNRTTNETDGGGHETIDTDQTSSFGASTSQVISKVKE